jgi:hypothetical protein
MHMSVLKNIAVGTENNAAISQAIATSIWLRISEKIQHQQMIDDTKDITVRGCDTGLLFLIWDDVFIIVINIKVDY